ncbi:MAG TPA: GNAT family N-acetyltransferase [Oligoflexia bacterium]|nr:GNAT family N-acetyltransferase [Oligoflexia bacterium]HMR25059.1 GNAT family N-acetyltransferase [Oligoflexia bacterium]
MDVCFRSAQLNDLDIIIKLLNQDHLGKTRESISEKILHHYQTAFKQLLDSKFFDIVIMEEAITHEIFGCAQVMYLPHLSFKGSMRLQIESIRVEKKFRNKGLGKQLMRHCIALAKQNNCKIIQFTSNKSRTDAHRFYTNLGFKPTHVGYKMYL